MIEIRWHGRGGQGTKTASLLLADVAFSTELNVQGFPEYGPERMGAPITAYNRLSPDKILIHSNIYEPDIVVVVDETLVEQVAVTAGLKKDGKIIVNTDKEASKVRAMLGDFTGKCFVVDANGISQKYLKRTMPNTALLAAVVKVSGIMESEKFFESMKESFQHKFSSKPEVIDGNLSVIRKAWEEVNKI